MSDEASIIASPVKPILLDTEEVPSGRIITCKNGEMQGQVMCCVTQSTYSKRVLFIFSFYLFLIF